MYSTPQSTRMIGMAVTTAMAGALLSGCAANSAPRAAVSAGDAQEALARGKADRAVVHAEAAVQAEPRNAAYRAMLAAAYLDAGRFASAEATFQDAMALGDNSPRTALSLALALTAQAKYSAAAALLNDWEGEIAPADLGLALALAGQPERGIHIMANAIRGGENTAKMRQNLAYAYAMAGRWREARLMAEQDVPAGLVGQRMAQWAELNDGAAYQRRVAGLLGVPAGVRDAGQPVHLALANNPGVDQLAAEALALAPVPQAELVIAPAPATPAGRVAIPVSGGELPAVGQPGLALQTFEAAQNRSTQEFQQAFSAPSLASGIVTQDTQRFAQEPAAKARSARAASEGTRQIAQRSTAASSRPAAATPAAATSPVPAADGSHLVQLGSFASEQGARRAWGIYVSRYPELANHEMVITEAVVRGKHYWRVSAGGYDRTASREMCRRVNNTGRDGCITWAAASPLPGAVDSGIRLARR